MTTKSSLRLKPFHTHTIQMQVDAITSCRFEFNGACFFDSKYLDSRMCTRCSNSYSKFVMVVDLIYVYASNIRCGPSTLKRIYMGSKWYEKAHPIQFLSTHLIHLEPAAIHHSTMSIDISHISLIIMHYSCTNAYNKVLIIRMISS